MNKLTLWLILSLSVVTIGAAGVVSIRQDNTVKKQKEEATLVVPGVMSEKQKKHSKLYKQFRRDGKIPDLINRHRIDLKIAVFPGTPAALPNVAPPTLQEIIQDAVCDSDAIVIGQITNKQSQLTEDQEFIFTDYEFAVGQILKNNAKSTILLDSKITITSPGGKIALYGHTFEAEDSSFGLLKTGDLYLLFLQYIDDTGEYKAFNSKGRFHLENGNAKKLTQEWLSSDLEKEIDLTNLKQQIDISLANDCNRKVKGGIR